MSGPARTGKQVRDAHRQALVLHFFLGIGLLVGLGVLNRALTPATLWVQWAALGWGALFLTHLAVFERGTIATMQGRKRRAAPRRDAS